MTEPVSCQGQFYAPGDAAGRRVDLRWSAGSLYLSEAEGEPIEQVGEHALSAMRTGFNLSMVKLVWLQDGAEHVVMLSAEACTRLVPASSPLAPQLAAGHGHARRLERRWRLGWVLLGGLIAIPVLLLALFLWFADPIADWAVQRMPPQVEAQLGELVLQQTRAQQRVIEQGPAVDALRQIGTRLLPDAAGYRWFIVEDPAVNAFAAPGGIVVVNTGLLRRAQSSGEVAGVLAHEIAHVQLHHGSKAIIKGMGLRALMAVVVGDYGQLGDWAGQLTELGFSRDAEREADARGLDTLLHAGVDPQGMLDFFARMAKDDAGGPAWLSTHPGGEERLETLRARVAAAGARRDYQALPVDIERLRQGI